MVLRLVVWWFRPLLYIGGVLAEVMAPVAAVRPLVLNLISLFIKKVGSGGLTVLRSVAGEDYVLIALCLCAQRWQVVPLLTSKKLLRKHPDVTDDFFDCLTRVVDYYPKELFQLNGIAAATMMVRFSPTGSNTDVFFWGPTCV